MAEFEPSEEVMAKYEAIDRRLAEVCGCEHDHLSQWDWGSVLLYGQWFAPCGREVHSWYQCEGILENTNWVQVNYQHHVFVGDTFLMPFTDPSINIKLLTWFDEMRMRIESEEELRKSPESVNWERDGF